MKPPKTKLVRLFSYELRRDKKDKVCRTTLSAHFLVKQHLHRRRQQDYQHCHGGETHCGENKNENRQKLFVRKTQLK